MIDLLSYLPKALIDAGGWVTVAALAVGVVILLIRGKLVPGFIYDREVARATKATEQLERQAETQEAVSRDLAFLLDLLKSVIKVPLRS